MHRQYQPSVTWSHFCHNRWSNQEHESKRARRDYERRVHTVSPRLPLNRLAWSLVPITFDESDFQVRDFPYSDAFVAIANVAGYTLHNILIDTGSSTDILFIKAFESIGLDRRTLELVGNSCNTLGVTLYRFAKTLHEHLTYVQMCLTWITNQCSALETFIWNKKRMLRFVSHNIV